MKIIDCGGQRTQAWFDWHLGRLTSSRISDAVAKRKRGTGELQCRADLRVELAVERVTKKPSEHFVSFWMERGAELEPLARAAYELRADTPVNLVDFILHPQMGMAACSPDGLVEGGLVELKVPKPTTHAEYLLGEVVPEIYVPQIQWQLACTGREFCDFVSYCPDFPDPLDLFVCRMSRDDKRIAEMEAEAEEFLREVDAVVTQLTGGLEALLKSSVPRAVIPA